MPLPLVAIVGRPNVGKSSLFNTIVGRRVSITEPTAGVTRDRVSEVCEIDGLFFELVDTGGHGVVDRDDLSEHVEEQIRYAIDRADLILFVVDGREGITPLDRDTAELLRRKTELIIFVANKVDEPHMAAAVGELRRLGYGDPLCVSALNGNGKTELLERIHQLLGGRPTETPPEAVMKIAIVGKRNSGKSSFINALAGEPRVIVSEVPGTTRDSIDVRFEKDGRTLIAIDTAGVRKKNKLADDIEFFAHQRALSSIRRADVVLFLIDATVPVGQVEKRLAAVILADLKPCVLVINKWDLAKGRAATGDFGPYLAKVLPQMGFAPVAFTSAIDGKNVASVIDLAASLFKQCQTQVTTGRLNQALQDALASGMPTSKKSRKPPKFYYATQIASAPPTLLIFVNAVARVDVQHERFLINRFRETLPFNEIPIRLVFRSRRGSPAEKVAESEP
ncbi:MAG: ribosome biogenesis GTPase Der [Planctomycetota bacterium]